MLYQNSNALILREVIQSLSEFSLVISRISSFLGGSDQLLDSDHDMDVKFDTEFDMEVSPFDPY